MADGGRPLQWADRFTRVPGAGPAGPRLALGGALGAVALYLVAVLTEPGQWVDVQLFGRLQTLGVGPIGDLLPFLGRRVLPGGLAVVVSLLAVHTLATGGTRAVARCLVLIVSTVVGCWILREHVLGRPFYGPEYAYPFNTFPSTHMSLVGSMCVAVWWLAREQTRRLGWLLVAIGVLAALGNVVGHAHRPSDVVGAVLIVAGVAGLVGGRGRTG